MSTALRTLIIYSLLMLPAYLSNLIGLDSMASTQIGILVGLIICRLATNKPI